MQRVHFCTGASFLTGDRIAASLMRYAKALGQTAEFDVVEIPTLRADGSVGCTTLMIGPTSQISAELLAAGREEITDESLVAVMDARGAHLLAPRPPSLEAAGYLPFSVDEMDL